MNPTQTDDKRTKTLELVRKLIAKANSSEFEAERQTFLAKADSLMDEYAIEQWQLMQTDNKQGIVQRRDLDVSWWQEYRANMHYEARQEIVYLWQICMAHCRCTSTMKTWDYQEKTAAVYGTAGDLAYFDLLFTDLLLQVIGKVQPSVDPDKTLGENLVVAKEAGMKWKNIARWLDRDDPDGHSTHTKLFAEYRRELKAKGLTPAEAVSVHPDSWMISWLEGFTGAVGNRLFLIRDEREEAVKDTMALVVADVREASMEMLFGDFPHLRPHEPGCDCKKCTSKRLPARSADAPRQHIYAASSAGRTAGANARIASNRGVGESKGGRLT